MSKETERFQSRKTGRSQILVTSGAGFIAANLIRMLVQLGYQVTALDNLSTRRREYLKGLPIEFALGDILDLNLVAQVVPGHSAIAHLATIRSTNRYTG